MADPLLPNKCKLCGLCVQYTFSGAAQTTGSDQAFANLRALFERRIVRQRFSRVVGMSNIPGDFGSTEFCAVSSKAWQRNDKKCPHWLLKIDGASIADYLSIYESRNSVRQTLWAALIALIVSAVFSLVQTFR